MAIGLDLLLDNRLGRFRSYTTNARVRSELAGLIASDRASTVAQRELRTLMRGAGLGRLGNAIGQTSDLKKTATVFRRAQGWSASGVLFIRSKSERTLGALEAYLQGANIAPVRSRYLWIPSDDIPRLSKRRRLTPRMWRQNGLDQRIGPLVPVTSRSGTPLLVVRNVGVNAAGRPRSARSLTRRGLPRRNDVRRDFVIAFVGIPRTTRRARVNATALFRRVQAEMPRFLDQALRRTLR